MKNPFWVVAALVAKFCSSSYCADSNYINIFVVIYRPAGHSCYPVLPTTHMYATPKGTCWHGLQLTPVLLLQLCSVTCPATHCSNLSAGYNAAATQCYSRCKSSSIRFIFTSTLQKQADKRFIDQLGHKWLHMHKTTYGMLCCLMRLQFMLSRTAHGQTSSASNGETYSLYSWESKMTPKVPSAYSQRWLGSTVGSAAPLGTISPWKICTTCKAQHESCAGSIQQAATQHVSTSLSSVPFHLCPDYYHRKHRMYMLPADKSTSCHPGWPDFLISTKRHDMPFAAALLQPGQCRYCFVIS